METHVAKQAAEVIRQISEEVEEDENGDLPTVSDTDGESVTTSDSETEEKDKSEYIAAAFNVSSLCLKNLQHVIKLFIT